jgi:hypothetical protein
MLYFGIMIFVTFLTSSVLMCWAYKRTRSSPNPTSQIYEVPVPVPLDRNQIKELIVMKFYHLGNDPRCVVV